MKIDYVAVVRDLEHKRSAIDLVLDGLRKLASGEPGPNGTGAAKRLLTGGVRRRPVKTKPAVPTPAPATAAGHRGHRATVIPPEKLARAKAAWGRGEKAHAVAQRAGIGYSTLYALVKREGWAPRGNGGAPAGHPRTRLRDPGYVPSGAE